MKENGRDSTAGIPVHSAHLIRFCLPACRWHLRWLGMQDRGQFQFIRTLNSRFTAFSDIYLCLQTATTASWDKLDFIMESMANKHTIADNQQVHLA